MRIMADSMNQAYTERGLLLCSVLRLMPAWLWWGRPPGAEQKRRACSGTISAAIGCGNGWALLGSSFTRRSTSRNCPWILLSRQRQISVTSHRAQVLLRNGIPAYWRQCPAETLVLVGSYAELLLGKRRHGSLTETVRHFRDYLPRYFP